MPLSQRLFDSISFFPPPFTSPIDVSRTEGYTFLCMFGGGEEGDLI